MFTGVQVILTHANDSQRPISDKFDVFRRNATSKFRVKFEQRAPYQPRNETLHSNLCLSNSSVHSLLTFGDKLFASKNLVILQMLRHKCYARHRFGYLLFFFCFATVFLWTRFFVLVFIDIFKVDMGKKCSCLLHHSFLLSPDVTNTLSSVLIFHQRLNIKFPSAIKQE